MNTLYKELKNYGRVKTNELLSKHTTFKIGGAAKFFIIVNDRKKTIELLNFLSSRGIDYFILGGGSNILVSDNGLSEVVIKIEFNKIELEDNYIVVDSGASFGFVVNSAVQNSLTGLEWAIGIPGTIGGAIRGNAGAMGCAISDIVEEVQVWQDGEVSNLLKSECNFSYRSSDFKLDGMVILSIKLKLLLGDKKEIGKKIHKYMLLRNDNHPSSPSAGSFFKNIKISDWKNNVSELPEIFRERGMIPVGWLVEQLGLKGYRVGGGGVSKEHGNFIINYEKAKYSDILEVVEVIKNKVYNKYGIELVSEVEILK